MTDTYVPYSAAELLILFEGREVSVAVKLTMGVEAVITYLVVEKTPIYSENWSEQFHLPRGVIWARISETAMIIRGCHDDATSAESEYDRGYEDAYRDCGFGDQRD